MNACRRCPCGGHYEDGVVEVRLGHGDDVVVLADVFHGACQSCGGRVYPVETLERVESVHRREPVDRLLGRISGPSLPGVPEPPRPG